MHAWAAPHEPPTAALVVALKESGARSLTPLLACLLAGAISQVLPPGRPLRLLPIPQRPRNRLRRPADPVVQLARGAAHALADLGLEVQVEEALMWVRSGPDQSRLRAEDRRGNVSGAMSVRTGREPGHAVLVDDVLTTGATALEAARAARSGGWEVAAVASVTHPRRPSTGMAAGGSLEFRVVATQSGPSAGIAPGRSPLASQS